MSWNKTRFSQWEVEGAVRERVQTALAQSEHDRLVSHRQGESREPAVARLLSLLGTGLDRATGGLRASTEAIRAWMAGPMGLEKGGEGRRKSR